MNARYYDPGVGRFISRDSYLGSSHEPWTQHLYGYTGGNPVNYIDPTGHFFLAALIIGAIAAGAIIGATYGAVKSYQETGSVNLKTVVTYTGVGAVGGLFAGTVAAAGASLIAPAVSMGSYYLGSSAAPILAASAKTIVANATISAYDDIMAIGTGNSPIHDVMGDNAGLYEAYKISTAFSAVGFTAWGQTAQGLGYGTYPMGGESVHGNSLKSTKPHHGYEIYDIKTGDVVKTGISGQELNMNGTSPRANAQVNSWNKSAGHDQYAARVTNVNIPDRAAALIWERSNSLRLWNEGNSMNRHLSPTPWLD